MICGSVLHVLGANKGILGSEFLKEYVCNELDSLGSVIESIMTYPCCWFAEIRARRNESEFR